MRDLQNADDADQRNSRPAEAAADDPDAIDIGDASTTMPERPVVLGPTPAGRCIAQRGCPLHLCPTSLNLTTREGVVKAFNARTMASLPARADGVQEIDLQDWLAMWVDGTDPDTGEQSNYPWLVLIAPDGSQIGTSSPTVAHQLADLLRLVEAGILTLPVRVRITPTRARKSTKTYHSLSIVAEG